MREETLVERYSSTSKTMWPITSNSRVTALHTLGMAEPPALRLKAALPMKRTMGSGELNVNSCAIRRVTARR